MDKLVGIVSGVLGILAFIIPEIPLVYRFVAFLTILCLYLIILICYFHKSLLKIKREFNEVTKRHKALSKEFDKLRIVNEKQHTTMSMWLVLLQFFYLNSSEKKEELLIKMLAEQFDKINEEDKDYE